MEPEKYIVSEQPDIYNIQVKYIDTETCFTASLLLFGVKNIKY